MQSISVLKQLYGYALALPPGRLMPHTFCFRGNPVRGAAKRTAQRRRRGAAEPRVEEHVTAGSGTLGSRAECGTSPARAAQQLCRPCRHARQAKRGVGPSAESAAQQSPGRKPWEWHGLGESPERAMQSVCAALSGLNLACPATQGSGARCRVLLHPGLFCAAPSALPLLTLA
jgi:hypothetical protein